MRSSCASGAPRQPQALDQLLERVVGGLGVKRKLAECRAQLAWPDTVGPALAEHTQALRVRHGRLEVAVPTAVWRSQLSFLRADIIARLNQHAGMEVITDLVLLNKRA